MKPCLIVSLVAVAFAGGVLSTATRADVLLVERAQEAQAMNLPARGMSMAQVERQFGAPVSKRGAVGGGSEKQPPITRWVYADYTVYFEHSHVVDAVLNKASPDETGPKPIQ
ncbi:MAG: hypothetical protein KDI75_07375 [Xanthomonadales bacterium]|nr:hypothetical protein [Xanthomonadales bacterium]